MDDPFRKKHRELILNYRVEIGDRDENALFSVFFIYLTNEAIFQITLWETFCRELNFPSK